MLSLPERTKTVREAALALGFDACGFSKARRLNTEADRLEKWLMEGCHGNMRWMEDHFDKRVDPTLLVPGAKSVVSLILSYHNKETAAVHNGLDYKIAKYALGDDYHEVMKDKLNALMRLIHEKIGAAGGRAFVDSAPVLDKAWAVQAGIGWQGKNANLLTKKSGSFFVIGELILDMEFEYDHSMKDLCGSCTRCIDACPTGAIYEPYKVDGSRCISYFTIELREQIPAEFHEKLGSWMFGCDICQDVCPWNRIAQEGREPALQARPELLQADETVWKELNLNEYRRLFKKSAVKRTKFEGIQRNITIVSSNKAKKDQT